MYRFPCEFVVTYIYIRYCFLYFCTLELVIEKGVTNITLNFGPQHPAAHGVLRLVLELNGEVCPFLIDIIKFKIFFFIVHYAAIILSLSNITS